MSTFRIRNWESTYENNRTRELVEMRWVPIPNRQDSDGYTMLIEKKNGPAIFGAWIAILQVASRCKVRGTLTRDGEIPHSAASLARMTRFPVQLIEESLFVLVNECKWLEIIDMQEGATIPHPDAGIPHGDATIPQASDYGMEWNGKNGMELNGEEKENVPQEKKKRTKKKPEAPTDDELLDYFSQKHEGIDIEEQLNKCKLWCEDKGHVISKLRLSNWIDKAIKEGWVTYLKPKMVFVPTPEEERTPQVDWFAKMQDVVHDRLNDDHLTSIEE